MTKSKTKDWTAFVEGLNAEFGVSYTAEQIADPDWCFKEIGRLGYSCQITLITPEIIRQRWETHKIDPSDKERREYLEEIERNGGFYTYQLQGHQYKERGSHQSPMSLNLQDSAAVALYNVLKVRPTA
jgi:hypothetical protein